MNTVSIVNSALVVQPRGLDKLWSFRRRLVVPLAHVRGATVDVTVGREAKGVRAPGLALLGKYAGTFHRDGERIFWNISRAGTPIVIELTGERFARLILSVDNAAELVDRINAARATTA